jgi:hypothetical protein
MLMQATKAFVFKERSLSSLVWLWGFFGTILLFLLIDALATTPLLKRILYLEDWIYWLVPIYYFFIFFFSFGDINLSFKSILHTFFHFIGQIAAFLIFFSFWGVFAIFGGTDYQVNTYSLKQEAPTEFTENSKLQYPSDAELIHTSFSNWGANVGTDIIIKVEDIDSFVNTAVTKYKFYEMTMDFPGHDREYLGYGFDPFQGILSPPFCSETPTMVVKPRYFKVTKKLTDPENFCGKREVYFSQLKREPELSILMVIFPKEGLVWLNRSDWF